MATRDGSKLNVIVRPGKAPALSGRVGGRWSVREPSVRHDDDAGGGGDSGCGCGCVARSLSEGMDAWKSDGDGATKLMISGNDCASSAVASTAGWR